MIKVYYIIDGDEYIALMQNTNEICEFIIDCTKENMDIRLIDYYNVSIQDVLDDDDFNYSYKIENIAIFTLPNAHTFEKWTYQEAELKRLHII